MIDMNNVTSYKNRRKEKISRITISIQRNLLKTVDTMRKDVPRSRFFQRVIKQFLDSEEDI